MEKNLYKYNSECIQFEEVETADYDTKVAKIIMFCILFAVGLGLLIMRINYLQNKVTDLKIQQHISDSTIVYLRSETMSVVQINDVKSVTATCYRTNESETDATPCITADGSIIDTTKIDELRWIAISRDLEASGWEMGDEISVSGIGKDYDGVWIIKDRMNKRFTNKIDFLISKTKQGNLFKNVKVRKL